MDEGDILEFSCGRTVAGAHELQTSLPLKQNIKIGLAEMRHYHLKALQDSRAECLELVMLAF